MPGIQTSLPVILLLIFSGPLWASVVDEMQSLLQRGAALSAYEVGAQQESARAGDVDFDFWFGLAALEAGYGERAVFALERVLLQQPDHYRARLELGRAYYSLGDLSAARSVFDSTLTLPLPVNVRTRVEAYLQSIERDQRRRHGEISTYVALGLGTDSNIRSATAESTLQIPALGQLQLSEDSLEAEDEFSELTLGLNATRPVTKYTSGFVAASLRQRIHFSDDDYELGVGTLRMGMQREQGRDQVRMPVTLQKLTLGNESYRNLISVGLEWNHQQDRHNRWSLFSQAGAFRYHDDSSLDVNLRLLGMAWMQRLQSLPVQWSANLYVGDEHAVDTANDHNGKGYHGARLGVEWQYRASHIPYLSLTYQASEYAAAHPVFDRVRDDELMEFRLGWRWQYAPKTSVRLEFNATRNDANISLYEYDRNQTLLELRHGF